VFRGVRDDGDHPTPGGASPLCRGLRGDEVVQIREKFEISLRPPLVIDENTNPANVTVSLALSECFREANGSLFNPRRLNNEAQLRARFRQLIRQALRAFEDSNRNGEDDRDTDSDH
jgi:hypothetical protein